MSYPTSGTIFANSSTPLRKWFQAIHMMATSRNGVAALELGRTFTQKRRCCPQGLTCTMWMLYTLRQAQGERKTGRQLFAVA